MVHRYACGRMDPAERDAFEQVMLMNPELAAAVEIEQSLRRALVAEKALLSTPMTAVPSHHDWISRARRWQPLAAAAVLVALAGTAWQWQALPGPAVQPPHASTVSKPLEPMRAWVGTKREGNTQISVRLEPGRDVLFDVETAATAPVDVSMQSPSGSEAFHARGLQPDRYGSVQVLAEARALGAGLHEISVWQDGNRIEHYAVNIEASR